MSHPSFLALDTVAVGADAAEVRAHVDECPRCAAHVAAVRIPAPFPAALEALRVAPPAPAPHRWWRPLTLAVSTLVLLGLSTWVFRPRPAGDEVTAKGPPTAVVWLNRGGVSSTWAGEQLREGDAVRLEIAPAGFTHVAIVDEPTGRVLYEARVPLAGPIVSPAWKLDGAATAERLRVVLSRDTPALQTDCVSTPQQWCTRFVLERENR